MGSIVSKKQENAYYATHFSGILPGDARQWQSSGCYAWGILNLFSNQPTLAHHVLVNFHRNQATSFSAYSGQ